MCNYNLGRSITAMISYCCLGWMLFQENHSPLVGKQQAGEMVNSLRNTVTSRKQLTTRPAFWPTVAPNLVCCCWDRRNKGTYVRSLKTFANRKTALNLNLKFYIMSRRGEHTHTYKHVAAKNMFTTAEALCKVLCTV